MNHEDKAEPTESALDLNFCNKHSGTAVGFKQIYYWFTDSKLKY